MIIPKRDTKNPTGMFATPISDWNYDPEDIGIYEHNVPIELMLARKEFNDVAKATGYLSPCQRAPMGHDMRPQADEPGRVTESVYAYTERAGRAIESCLGCHLFVPCLKVRRNISMDQPEITGVVAGDLIDPTKTGNSVRAYLALRGA